MMATTQRSTRLSDRLAWLLFGLTCAFTALGLVFLALSWSAPVPDTFAFRGHAALLALAFGSMGQFLARRLPRNSIGWLFLVGAIAGSIQELGQEYAAYALLMHMDALPATRLIAWIASWIFTIGLGSIMLVVLLFPDGRLPSKRWRPFAWLQVGLWVTALFGSMIKPGPLRFAPFLDNPFGSEGAWQLVTAVTSPILAISVVIIGASIILRLRRARGIERQQLKWFTYTAALTCVVGIIYTTAYRTLAVTDPALIKPIDILAIVIPLAIPFAVGFAILRYRLWDIDIIIRRALIYGVLTAMLGVVYFGSVILMQELFRTVTRQRSELAIILSTLAIAALFNPLRRRVQDAIDRRFYRRKYDAAKVITAFSATVRDEVDLNKLSDRLLEVVEETMQPAHVSLWLRPSADGGPLTTERGVKR